MLTKESDEGALIHTSVGLSPYSDKGSSAMDRAPEKPRKCLVRHPISIWLQIDRGREKHALWSGPYGVHGLCPQGSSQALCMAAAFALHTAC
jgi:hypothetical protein